MRSISVKVSNPNERDAVLKAFERCNCHWRGGETPTAWRPMRNYPYYIDRRKDGVLTYGVKNLFKILPVEKFMGGEQEMITIYSDGKTVRAVGKDGSTGVARCSPEDEFDLSVGAKLAIDRLDTIKTGDIVRVENNGELYRGFYSFFGEHKLPIDWAGRYQYTQSLPNDAEGIVLAIQTNRGRKIAVLNFGHKDRGRIYLVGVDGLKKV